MMTFLGSLAEKNTVLRYSSFSRLSLTCSIMTFCLYYSCRVLSPTSHLLAMVMDE